MTENTLETQQSKSKLESALLSTSPTKLIVLNYDVALSSLKAATRAIERNDIEARCNAVTRAIDAISELYLSLNRKDGGDLAANLSSIYSYMIWNLPKINFDNDAKVVDEIIGLLKKLRSSWVKVDSEVSTQLATEQEATDLAQSSKASSKTQPNVA